MVKISSEARVKLETLAPQVIEFIEYQLAMLRYDQTRANLEAEGKIKQIPDLDNTYSLQVSNYELILESEPGGFTKGGSPILSDIINISRLGSVTPKALHPPAKATAGADAAGKITPK